MAVEAAKEWLPQDFSKGANRARAIQERLQGGAPKIAKLVYNSNFTMVYGTYNYS